MYSFEPKYFVYAQEVQVGPFQKTQLIDEIEKQNLGQDAYVWAEGMKDWVLLSDYNDLQQYVQYLPQATNVFSLQRQNDLYKNLNTQILNSTLNSEEIIEGKPAKAPAEKEIQAVIESYSKAILAVKKAVTNKFVLAGSGAFVLVLSLAIYQWTKPSVWEQIEASSEQIKELKWTLAQTGADTAYFSLASIKGDQREPQYALATNLPSGTRLKIELQGIRSTLVGAMSSQLLTEVEVKDGFAVTNKLRRNDGAFLPTGAYKVKISCTTCNQADAQQSTWLSAPVFIGIASSEYQGQLTEFHKLMRDQAQSELQELNDIYQFLYQVIGDRLRKRNLTSQQQAMFKQLEAVIKPGSVEGLAEHYVLHFIYRDLASIYTGLQQMPAELGSLRRQLDQLQSRHRQAQVGLNSNFISLLDTI